MSGSSSSSTLSNSNKSETMTYVSQIDELTKEVVKLIEASEGSLALVQLTNSFALTMQCMSFLLICGRL